METNLCAASLKKKKTFRKWLVSKYTVFVLMEPKYLVIWFTSGGTIDHEMERWVNSHSNVEQRKTEELLEELCLTASVRTHQEPLCSAGESVQRDRSVGIPVEMATFVSWSRISGGN